MESRMAAHPKYPDLLKILQLGKETFLDVGCCMGTDLRRYFFIIICIRMREREVKEKEIEGKERSVKDTGKKATEKGNYNK